MAICGRVKSKPGTVTFCHTSDHRVHCINHTLSAFCVHQIERYTYFLPLLTVSRTIELTSNVIQLNQFAHRERVSGLIAMQGKMSLLPLLVPNHESVMDSHGPCSTFEAKMLRKSRKQALANHGRSNGKQNDISGRTDVEQPRRQGGGTVNIFNVYCTSRLCVLYYQCPTILLLLLLLIKECITSPRPPYPPYIRLSLPELSFDVYI